MNEQQITAIFALVITTLVVSLGHAIFHVVERALKPKYPQLAESVEKIERTVFQPAPAPGFVEPAGAAAAEDAKVTPIRKTETSIPTIPPTAASILIFACALALGAHVSGCTSKELAEAATIKTQIDAGLDQVCSARAALPKPVPSTPLPPPVISTTTVTVTATPAKK